MANTFGTDILIQAPDPEGRRVVLRESTRLHNYRRTRPVDRSPRHTNTNLFIEKDRRCGPLLEVTVDNVEMRSSGLSLPAEKVVKDEPNFPRCYVQDPFGSDL